MKVLITGSSKGIGRAIALRFLQEPTFTVIGIDKEDSTINNSNYIHYKADIRDKKHLPIIKDINILINNAGIQDEKEAIETNLLGTINITELYAFNPFIKSVLFNISASAHTGFEFPNYVASKAALLGYMKNYACRLAKEYRATCNNISCGGVITELNKPVLEDKKLWNQIMKVTPLKKWAKDYEIAERAYFITVSNFSMTGQDIIIDNGEKDLNNTFVWPDYE